MTQKKLILRHLQEFGSITPVTALREYGCFRLAARIADLREDGYEIKSELVKAKNKQGKTVTFSRYKLA